ncbi:ISAzo13 family transposase [Streptomyces sp. NBC_00289]|uniref:ISAzo13 family transposase n=2 Tax=Streptomyces sp. NBC_00289 TaxID=2975703 RepID=UPI00352D6391
MDVFGLLLPHLDERQQRLTLGAAAARVLGHGGIRRVAQAAGVAESTVSRGKRELEDKEESAGRVRAPGAGRRSLREVDPGLVPALLALVEPDQRGDPESPLLWTVKSTRNLAAELTRQGRRVGSDTVGLTAEGGGVLPAGHLEDHRGSPAPGQDAQFRYINDQVTAYLADGQPVISVDAKKKETLGSYAVIGREWHRAGQPVQVRAHDFPEKGAQKAVPYGIYDIGADAGWVSVGCDGDTSAFAVATLRRWWNGEGRRRYPHASRLLVTADAGGSNGYRVRAWKKELADFAYETGVDVTVCHFLPGTSKWNKIEHRLFSQISINWRGRPLTSHEVVVSTIGATTTRNGLSSTPTSTLALTPPGAPSLTVSWTACPSRRTTGTARGTTPCAPNPSPLNHPRPVPSSGVSRPVTSCLPGCGTPASPDSSPPPSTSSPPATKLVHRAPADLSARKRPAGGPGAGGRRLSVADQLIVFLLKKRWSMDQAPLAEATGLPKSRIGATLRETTPVLAALGHTVSTGALTMTTAQQLAEIAGHDLTPP